jgi:hypothetical protein
MGVLVIVAMGDKENKLGYPAYFFIKKILWIKINK